MQEPGMGTPAWTRAPWPSGWSVPAPWCWVSQARAPQPAEKPVEITTWGTNQAAAASPARHGLGKSGSMTSHHTYVYLLQKHPDVKKK